MVKGTCIGQGRTAEIFLWGDQTVLKLFRPHLHPSVVDSEIHANEVLLHVPIPAPRLLDVVEVDGRKGIVLERVDGESMLKQIFRRPWQVRQFARTFAELHATMHRATCEALPAQRLYWERKIHRVNQLTEGEKEQVLHLLSQLPGGVQVCHGDFHPDNVMMTSGGPVIIDWSNATAGDPAGDVARTAMIFRVGGDPNPLVNIFVRALAKRFHDIYLREYLQLTGLTLRTIQAWELPLFAARLLESPPKAEEELVMRRVRELLKKIAVDS